MEVKRALTEVFSGTGVTARGTQPVHWGLVGRTTGGRLGLQKLRLRKETGRKCVCGREWWVNGAASARRLSVVGEWGVIRELWRKAARCTDRAGRQRQAGRRVLCRACHV